MNWIRVISCVVLVSQSACTSNPNNINPDYVSPRLYSAYDCEKLFLEKRKLQNKVDDLVHRQNSNRATDAAALTVGIVILWPALLALPFTKDRKREISRLMGEDEAITDNIEKRKCVYDGDSQG